MTAVIAFRSGSGRKTAAKTSGTVKRTTVNFKTKGTYVPKQQTPVKQPEFGSFTDVYKDAWYYNDVEWAYTQKLMIGVGKQLFRPNGAITMPEVATVMARISKADLDSYEAA